MNKMTLVNEFRYFLTFSRTSSRIQFSGIPQSPKPPSISVMLSSIPTKASCALAYTFLLIYFLFVLYVSKLSLNLQFFQHHRSSFSTVPAYAGKPHDLLNSVHKQRDTAPESSYVDLGFLPKT